MKSSSTTTTMMSSMTMEPQNKSFSSISNFNTHFSHLNTLLISPPKNDTFLNFPSNSLSIDLNLNNPSPKIQFQSKGHNQNSNFTSPTPKNFNFTLKNSPNFLSTSISIDQNLPNPPDKIQFQPKGYNQNPNFTLKSFSTLERALIGACAGGSAGAFTYCCLHPLDTIKTKLQTKGASQIYKNTLDVIVKTFQSKGILGFYSGISAVIVGSAASSAVYFGTCEFGKSFLSKFEKFPRVLIPPISGAMGNIVSSAIMVPKELITQRMQAGAKGRSWEVLVRILEKDGVLGLYSGYSATLLRNLPAGVISYSSFEYLKTGVLLRKGKSKLDPFESVCCGALAGAISSSLTTPLDVVKTRLMTQVHGEVVEKVAAVMYGGISETVKQILKEEGWVGLTRGMGPRVVHSACFSALGYFAFETARVAISEQYLKSKEFEEVVVVPVDQS